MAMTGLGLRIGVGTTVILGLALLHILVTHGTGVLPASIKAHVAITPNTTLSRWWHHLVAGFFHHTYGHIAYNLTVFAIAFPFATRQMSPLATMANAYWIGPFVVFALHLLVVLPLARAGVPYAVGALDYQLVGFSVMTYSIVGAALTLAPTWMAITFAGVLIAFEIALAIITTGPFVFLYHIGGFLLGYWVRMLWLRLPAGTPT